MQLWLEQQLPKLWPLCILRSPEQGSYLNMLGHDGLLRCPSLFMYYFHTTPMVAWVSPHTQSESLMT